jgi:hypothetical protein
MQNYVAPFEPHEDMLKTKEDMLNFCDNNNIAYKKSWTKDAFKDAILESGHDPDFYDDAKENHAQGRIILTDSEYKRILKIHDDIYASPLAETLSGMKKEVSVFWTDANGIDCKARFDAVGDDMFDLKTFDNFMGNSFENLAGLIIAKYGYDIQAVFYYEAYLACHKAGIEGFDNENPDFHLLFCQSKGGYNYIPATLKPVSYYGEINQYWTLAQGVIDNAKRLYKKHVMQKEPIIHDWSFQELFDQNLPYYHIMRGEKSVISD